MENEEKFKSEANLQHLLLACFNEQNHHFITPKIKTTGLNAKRRPGTVFFSKFWIVRNCPRSNFPNNLGMEEKFSFYAAVEVIDVWTGIWADRSQITASLP